MDLEKDLEELRKTCEMQVEGRKRDSKEIIIRDLDDCKFRVDHISVKAAENTDSAPSSIITISDPVIIQLDRTPTSIKKREEAPSSGFSKERDIPDVSTKVYDFALSKDRTLRASKCSNEGMRKLRQKWLCIGGLGISTLVLIVIVILVISLTDNNRNVSSAEQQQWRPTYLDPDGNRQLHASLSPL